MTITEIALIVLTVASVIVAIFVHWGPGLSLAALTALLAWYSFNNQVTAAPPTFARLMFWNKLLPQVINPRIAFVFEYFPLFEKLKIISQTPEVKSAEGGTELVFKGIRCKAEEEKAKKTRRKTKASSPSEPMSGGSVEVHIGFAFVADQGRSDEYIKSGETVEILKMLNTKLGAIVRHMGASMTWEEYAFSKATISMLLIIDLTGHQPTEKVERDPADNTKGVPDLNPAFPFHKYKVRDREENEDIDELDAENFINTTLADKKPDVHSWGILISQLVVTEVIPEGELKGAAELRARETQERRGEQTDNRTLSILISEIIADAKAHGETMTYKEALEHVQTNRAKISRRIVDVRTSGNPLLDAAAVVGIPTQQS